MNTVLSLFLIIAAALLRIARHFDFLHLPPNFAPITAIALFAGARMEKRSLAVLVPLAAMVASDAIIGFYDARILASVYASFILSGALGMLIRKRVTLWRVSGSAIASSLLFFLITNAAVWLFSGMYPSTLAGLAESYSMGLPFFRFTLLGDLFYTIVIFGIYEVVHIWIKVLSTTKPLNALIWKSSRN